MAKINWKRKTIGDRVARIMKSKPRIKRNLSLTKIGKAFNVKNHGT